VRATHADTLVKSITYGDVPKQIVVAEVVDRNVTCSGTRRNSTASTEIGEHADPKLQKEVFEIARAPVGPSPRLRSAFVGRALQHSTTIWSGNIDAGRAG